MGCPFIKGASYRVRRDFKAFRDEFRAGEVLVFKSEAYSRYDGMTGYFFTAPDSEAYRSWDVSDEDEVSVWKDLFERL